MPQLTVVRGADERAERLGDLNDLRETPRQRPGIAYVAVPVAVPVGTQHSLRKLAFDAGVRYSYWTALAVEASRAARTAAAALRTDARDVINELDAAVGQERRRRDVNVAFRFGRRLAIYARGLIENGHAPSSPPTTGELVLPVPYHTALAWELASAEAGQGIENWILDLLADPPVLAHAWEAEAARSGQTLSEWVAVQAARRSACR